RIIILFLTAFAAYNGLAQQSNQISYKEWKQTEFVRYKAEQQAKFQKYKSDKQKEYDAYRQKMNAEYAAFMEKQWEACKLHDAIPVPKDQDAPQPTMKQGNAPSEINEIRYKLVIKLEAYEVPEPVVPIVEPPVDDKPEFKFIFHGTPCSVHLKDVMKYSLPDAYETSAGEMWLHLSDETYDALISDCLKMRSNLQLSDWGYINMLQALTQQFYGGNTNEAVLTQMYILTQSGYNVRIARCNERLVLLVPFDANLYGYSLFILNETRYYILDKVESDSRYFVFNKSFPEAKTPSLRMMQSPQLAHNSANARTLTSSRYPGMRATITENSNLIDFYNEYPLSSNWDYYSTASFSNETKQALYPALKREIAGKTVVQAANMLINFVQTAFRYKTDGDQFGYERPLFGDETIFYPYSDCEDRAIFYSILVRELLGLEVVLLYYPNHLATAVVFPDNKAYGDYFRWSNKVYTICDPTYIGADIGECMPQFKQTAPNVIQIQ
ncbi:MAG: hypothetical protein IJQ97_02980, partial [Paludibacteraceae bacterium]|nr:hypothetical protein [Paludibacteraceae bacterium]